MVRRRASSWCRADQPAVRGSIRCARLPGAAAWEARWGLHTHAGGETGWQGDQREAAPHAACDNSAATTDQLSE